MLKAFLIKSTEDIFYSISTKPDLAIAIAKSAACLNFRYRLYWSLSLSFQKDGGTDKTVEILSNILLNLQNISEIYFF